MDEADEMRTGMAAVVTTTTGIVVIGRVDLLGVNGVGSGRMPMKRPCRPVTEYGQHQNNGD